MSYRMQVDTTDIQIAVSEGNNYGWHLILTLKRYFLKLKSVSSIAALISDLLGNVYHAYKTKLPLSQSLRYTQPMPRNACSLQASSG